MLFGAVARFDADTARLVMDVVLGGLLVLYVIGDLVEKRLRWRRLRAVERWLDGGDERRMDGGDDEDDDEDDDAAAGEAGGASDWLTDPDGWRTGRWKKDD